jgi:hypothetical protein
MNRFLLYCAVIGGGLLSAVCADDILSSSGFQTCGNGSQDVTVTQFELSFDRSNNQLTFAVTGDSLLSQKVTGINLILRFYETDLVSGGECVSSWTSAIYQ